MIEINADQVTAEIRNLFRRDEPQAPRCFRVLDGVVGSGVILVDDLENPTWSVVQEPHDHSLYFGGPVDSHIIRTVIDKFRQQGDVLVGMWLEDPRLELLPGDHYYDGRTLEFYDRPLRSGLSQYLDHLPEGCELHRLDRHSILHTEWGPGDVQFAGGPALWNKPTSALAW